MIRNLPEVEAEEVNIFFEGPRNILCNSNVRNDADCREVRWMENNLEAKRDHNDPIYRQRWGIQTITSRFFY